MYSMTKEKNEGIVEEVQINSNIDFNAWHTFQCYKLYKVNIHMLMYTTVYYY